jgi:hypothetical protein
MPICRITLKVCDVLPARMGALRSKDQGWQNVGERRRGNEAQRNDLADWNPAAAERRRSVYRVLSGGFALQQNLSFLLTYRRIGSGTPIQKNKFLPSDLSGASCLGRLQKNKIVY